eukprot:CAMPEP_0181209240 /NCGR_PEP_ID=MMETSP1096-20121128/22556_1 /TAXON_ID=156174 ORGANISM="Chrysochromulina ericina, Strain CCMP281" /NCGR_SAMPLE_ID=MMETSP1096 /ASSEMBLY_ACC=CAM_ASM_000453 /LENGTH=69 /DNA_ID=CAMNT_0023300379 /DNA_START=449 /DNA_END=658 /DNA_ORIENTATION=-
MDRCMEATASELRRRSSYTTGRYRVGPSTAPQQAISSATCRFRTMNLRAFAGSMKTGVDDRLPVGTDDM